MSRASLSGVLGLVACAAVLPAPAVAAPDTVTCRLERAGTEYKGVCAVPCLVNALKVDIDGPTPGATCDAPPRQVAATLRREAAEGRWLGTMEGKFPEDPTRFEVIEGRPGAPGVAKLPFGWFALSGAGFEDDAATLTIAADRTLAPTGDDLRILERAKALLADEARWNRQDTRKCPPGQDKLSLFCALTRATDEVSGGVHYRQPALQMAREVLNEVGGDRLGKHRLMDYNNHPDTTLGEVHALLDTARARLAARLR